MYLFRCREFQRDPNGTGSADSDRGGMPDRCLPRGMVWVLVGDAVVYWRQMSAPRRLLPASNPRPVAITLFVAAAVLIWLTAQTAAIGPKDRRLTNVRAGISIEAPAGWTFSQHTGYADTVVLLVHPDGSRVSVTATRTIARTAAALYQENRAGLVAQGLVPSPLGPGARGSLAVDLSAPGRTDLTERVRQLYLVRDIPGGRQAVVLTLVCRANAFAARAPALDFVVTRMVLEEPVPASGRASGGPAGATGHAGH